MNSINLKAVGYKDNSDLMIFPTSLATSILSNAPDDKNVVNYYVIRKTDQNNKLSNDLETASKLHSRPKSYGRIKEFTNSDETVSLPTWMMDLLFLEELETVTINEVKLNKGNKVTLAIHSDLMNFYDKTKINVEDHLTQLLQSYGCLCKDMKIIDSAADLPTLYKTIDIVSIYDSKDIERCAISSLNTDLNVDICTKISGLNEKCYSDESMDSAVFQEKQIIETCEENIPPAEQKNILTSDEIRQKRLKALTG